MEKSKAFITEKEFTAKREKALTILDLIDMLIVKYKSYTVLVSEVIREFYYLPEKFQEMFTNEKIVQVEREYLTKLCQYRFKFMNYAEHRLAYILDPSFIGDGL